MHFGTKGNGLKEFNTAHGMTLDTRYSPPRLLICDRNHQPKGRLLHYSLGRRVHRRGRDRAGDADVSPWSREIMSPCRTSTGGW